MTDEEYTNLLLNEYHRRTEENEVLERTLDILIDWVINIDVAHDDLVYIVEKYRYGTKGMGFANRLKYTAFREAKKEMKK